MQLGRFRVSGHVSVSKHQADTFAGNAASLKELIYVSSKQ
jgi:hypothetical protein